MASGDQEPRPDPLVGQLLLERYHLTRKIGEGGMGAVYEATHVALGKTVAVKVLREKYLDRPNVAQRLVKEAQLASAIRHEHIIDITDSGKTEDGRTFVVMEHLDGESLAELLRREGPLPEARAIEIARQVAEALGAAHLREIIHRDVKPENVFIVRGRERADFVKVVDFGISTMLRDSREGLSEDAENRLTSTGMVLGTPFYMSPEQARGDEQLDHRVDVYALGVILYECLTGEVPFRGANSLGIIASVLNDAARPPRELRPELRISEAIERVVMKAMAKAREDRYASMDSFAADLGRALTGELVEAPRAPSGAERDVGRSWVIVAILAAVMGGGALLLSVAERRRSVVASPPAVAAAPAPVLQSQPLAKTVVLHVETEPAGAEVRQGDRVFGVAPRDLVLPRSNVPARLTFVLDGYEPAAAEVVPLTDDSVRVKLRARLKPKAKPNHRNREESPPPAPSKPNRGETLPNPY